MNSPSFTVCDLARDLTRSRAALAVAGPSRSELRELRDRYAGEMAAAYETEQLARSTARQAADAARAELHGSRHAARLLEHHPDGTLRRRLAAARADLPAYAQSIDDRAAATARFSTDGAAARTEQQLRQHLAEQAPDRYAAEQRQRAQAQHRRTPSPARRQSPAAGTAAVQDRPGLHRSS